MSVETVISLADQLAVEPLFADPIYLLQPRRWPCAWGSKAKATLHSPSAAAEPQLLHICVARAVQRIDAGPPQLGPELLGKECQRQNLRPHGFLQREEFRLKRVADRNNPATFYNMTYSPYDLKYI